MIVQIFERTAEGWELTYRSFGSTNSYHGASVRILGTTASWCAAGKRCNLMTYSGSEWESAGSATHEDLGAPDYVKLGDFNDFANGQRALALSKGTWVIGSPNDPNEAGGIDPERDENLSQSGAVYILR